MGRAGLHFANAISQGHADVVERLLATNVIDVDEPTQIGVLLSLAIRHDSIL